MSACCARPAERRTMSALPFSDFLELLRAKGLGVGLHEHLAVGKLLDAGIPPTAMSSGMPSPRWSHATKTRRASFATCSTSSIHARLLRPSGRPRRTLWHRRRYRGMQLLRSQHCWAAHSWPSSPARSRQDSCCGTTQYRTCRRGPRALSCTPEVALPAPPPPDVPDAGAGTRDRVRRADAVLPCG